MSCNWPRFTIQELIDSQVITVHKDGNHGSNYPRASEFGDKGVAFLTAKLLDDAGNIDFAQAPRLSEEKAAKFKFGFIEKDDVLLSHNATVGRVAIVPNYGEKVLIGTSLTHYRLNSEKLLPQYLAAFFTSKDFQNQLAAVMSQTTRNQVPITAQRKLEVVIPPIKIQEQLTRISGSIIEKISLNTQTTQTLEEMAQAIFKSWFVDFDPVKAKMNGEQPKGMDTATASLFPEKLVESEIGLIPEGWVETPLYDIAEYINGAAYKKFEPNNEGIGLPIVKIAELKTGITQKTGFSTVDMPAKYRLEDNDMLFSWSGNPDTSIDTFVWALGEAWLNQHIFKVVPKSVLSRDYVLCLLKFMRPIFAEIARDKQTTGLGHVTVKDLKRLTVALPSEELLFKFNEKVSAIIAQNFSLVKQNQSLEKLRDTLLPKLLSGEIDLGETNPESIKEDI